MSSTTNGAAAAQNSGGGRTFGSGPRRTLVLLAAVAAVLASAGLALALAGSGSMHGSPLASVYAYHKGRIPEWIPQTKAPANPAPITASMVRPVSTLVEGDTVHAIFPRGMALVDVTGPTEPAWVERAIQSGHSRWGQQSPGTFTVTYSNVQGTVPVAAGAFLVKMPQGNFRAVSVHVLGGGRVPALLRSGQSLTLLLRFRLLPAGEGAIAWIPAPERLLAGWDFDFELT